MKIELNNPATTQLPVDRGAKQVSSSSSTGTQPATEDRISIHSDSQSVQTLTSQAMQSPPVRQDKVEPLRQSVASGTYKPDASKTAGAMIENDAQ